jgi:hypothetical protein
LVAILVFLQFWRNSVLANTLKRTLAHSNALKHTGSKAAAIALDPFRACGQMHYTFMLEHTSLTLERTSSSKEHRALMPDHFSPALERISADNNSRLEAAKYNFCNFFFRVFVFFL